MIGVIADTHGLLRPEALAALAGCERIIHAGDLGKPEIFAQLSRVAPTVAVRGNVDLGAWAREFPEDLNLSEEGVEIYVLHDLKTLKSDPARRAASIVISGHSHRPVIKQVAGVLYVNPGSAGPRRFSLPITVARLEISGDEIRVELVDVLTNTILKTLSVARRGGST